MWFSPVVTARISAQQELPSNNAFSLGEGDIAACIDKHCEGKDMGFQDFVPFSCFLSSGCHDFISPLKFISHIMCRPTILVNIKLDYSS